MEHPNATAVRVSVTNGDGIVAEVIEISYESVKFEQDLAQKRPGRNPWAYIALAITEELEEAIARAYDMD